MRLSRWLLLIISLFATTSQADLKSIATGSGGGGTPGGSSGQLQYNNAGALGGLNNGSVNGALLISNGASTPPSFIANSTILSNGALGFAHNITASSNTGNLAQAAPLNVDLGCTNFTGNFYLDCVTAFGYNVGSNAAYSTDNFAGGYHFESNFESLTGDAGGSGTATSVTTTTLTDTNQNWPVNGWTGYTLYNSTQGLSAKVVSNTATVITVGTTMTGQTGTPAYQLLNDTIEGYLQYQQEKSANPSNYRSIRPFFFTFDRGIADAQAGLGTNGAVTISAASATNPASFTTSVNHGLKSGLQVKLLSLAGGTWGTQLNGIQLPVTVTGATTFTLPVNATGFGTYTASSGTETAEPVMATTNVLANQNTGFIIKLPSWNPSSSDNVATFAPGNHVLYSPPFQPNTLTLTSGASFSRLVLQYLNQNQVEMNSSFTGTGQIVAYSNGSGGVQVQAFKRGSSTIGTTTFGPADQYNNVLVAISNNGGTASTPLLRMRQATSQTGDFIDAVKQDDSTVVWSISSAGNFNLPRISYNGTAPAVSACGTSPSIDGNATDSSGTVTVGTVSAASCTVTFNAAYSTFNHCRVTSQGVITSFAYSYTLSAITVTGTSLVGDKFDYQCDGK